MPIMFKFKVVKVLIRSSVALFKFIWLHCGFHYEFCPLILQVGYHPKYDKSHCFILERKDGTIEDFSYRKCITRALEIVAPARVKGYQSKMLKHFTDKAREDVFWRQSLQDVYLLIRGRWRMWQQSFLVYIQLPSNGKRSAVKCYSLLDGWSLS